MFSREFCLIQYVFYLSLPLSLSLSFCCRCPCRSCCLCLHIAAILWGSWIERINMSYRGSIGSVMIDHQLPLLFQIIPFTFSLLIHLMHLLSDLLPLLPFLLIPSLPFSSLPLPRLIPSPSLLIPSLLIPSPSLLIPSHLIPSPSLLIPSSISSPPFPPILSPAFTDAQAAVHRPEGPPAERITHVARTYAAALGLESRAR